MIQGPEPTPRWNTDHRGIRETAAVAVIGVVAVAVGVVILGGPARAATKTVVHGHPMVHPMAPRPVTIRVRTDQAGPQFTDWGFDLKQKCKPRQVVCSPVVKRILRYPSIAETIFGDRHMSVVRVSFRADEKGVNRWGNFDAGYYQQMIAALRIIRKANPQVRIFASRDSANDCETKVRGTPTGCYDYADALKDASGRLVPSRYGRLAASYLSYMDGQGLHVNLLGLDNEPTSNEGNLTPGRFLRAWSSVKAHYGGRLPRLIGNDPSNPDPDWLASAPAALWSALSIVSVHSNPDRWRHDQYAGTVRTAALAHAHHRPLWNTELHWTDRNHGTYDATVNLLGSVLDQMDLGFTGMTWWGYRADASTHKGQIMRALVTSLDGSRRLPTSDWDGDTTHRRSVITRAYRHGDRVFLWVVNDTDRPFLGRGIGLPGHHRTPTVERWVGTRMVHTVGTGVLVGGTPTVNVPAHSISLITIDERDRP